MAKIPKEVTNILIETGIQMLKIVKDLNEKDQLFGSSEKQIKTKKGKKDVVNPRYVTKKNPAVSG
jgi:heterodisulfide reductase subunit C